ncbi:hypothetical protein AXF42_Ash009856 [Apostasia shenzhenica]|uniref:Uncharacterized protein n=1 Tax=Apostasia shenzhenica TaxID=1088818 RepID=A0A2I0AXA2_9ASPA|nr:hypothetical protein AXF42_Ash009856 [Apostasia shenzhenica]
MEATLSLKPPRIPAGFHLQTAAAVRRSRHLRPTALRAVARAQTQPEGFEPRKKGLASVAEAAAVTIALACAVGSFCPRWSRRARAAAATWHIIPIQGSSSPGRPDSKQTSRGEAMQQKLREMFARKEMPENLLRMVPKYPLMEEYLKVHAKLTDDGWKILIGQCEKLKKRLDQEKKGKVGQGQIDIGVLLVDIYITKGDLAVANDINEKIIKVASEEDHRPKVRRAIINMFRDWERMNEEDKKAAWDKFAKELQKIASRSISIDEPVVD